MISVAFICSLTPRRLGQKLHKICAFTDSKTRQMLRHLAGFLLNGEFVFLGVDKRFVYFGAKLSYNIVIDNTFYSEGHLCQLGKTLHNSESKRV